VLNARPVEGFFRRLRWAADGILIAILFSIPWIRIGGEPLVLLDIPQRKFHVFGLVIFPQELYFLWLIVIGLALALFFFTALAGRLWCGWACPQTVFTDVFAWVAKHVEGWTKAGRPQHVALWRRVAIHAIWLVLSFTIAFHLVSYFVGAYELLARFRDAHVGRAATGFLIFTTAVTYFDFVILRQTFCRFLCPYARFQGVLFDRDTLIIGYDALRGEPRGKRAASAAARANGDCVDCGLCVAVCPASIDIRNGMQVDCIACTQCIDACNGVMAQVGRAPNLIGYRSLVGLERVRPVRLVRPRVVVYGALLAAVLGTFGVALARRELLDLHVAHNQTSLFGASADGRSTNGYILHITNRDRAQHVLRVRLDAPEEYELVAGVNPVVVGATSAVETSVFVLRDEHEHEEAEEQARESGARAAVHDLRFVLEPIDAPERAITRTIRFFERPGTVAAGGGGAR
jgi:cytochrome c oxidase accessory protein FixG